MKIPQLLFYIKRSLNKNVIIYKYNKTEKDRLNIQDPIDHYWILKENKNKIAPLNFLEKKLAYGFTVIYRNPHFVQFIIKPLPSYPLKIVPFKTSYIAQIKIDGRWYPLISVYVQLKKGFIKRVEWIEVYIKINETIKIKRLDIS